MESAKIKQGIGGRIADVAIYVVCGLFMLLCIYPFFQKYFVKGIVVGGVKG